MWFVDNRWGSRADAAANAVAVRNIRRLPIPGGTRMVVATWPSTRSESLLLVWDAHTQLATTNLFIDALSRHGGSDRSNRVGGLLRGYRLRRPRSPRTLSRGELAHLAFVMSRSRMLPGRRVDSRSEDVIRELRSRAGAFTEAGARASATPPTVAARAMAAAVLARHGGLDAARGIAESLWEGVDERGFVTDPDKGQVGRDIGMTTQATSIFLEIGMFRRLSAPAERSLHAGRLARLIMSIESYLCVEDGGLVDIDPRSRDARPGLLIRALAEAFTALDPREGGFEGIPEDLAGFSVADVRRAAASTVLASAEHVWKGRLELGGTTVFSNRWRRPARVPMLDEDLGMPDGRPVAPIPERALVVQLDAWAALEGAALVEAHETAQRRATNGGW